MISLNDENPSLVHVQVQYTVYSIQVQVQYTVYRYRYSITVNVLTVLVWLYRSLISSFGFAVIYNTDFDLD